MGKTTKSYKREQGLTIEQLNAIDLLITGRTDKEVAEVIGVNRVTVTKWRNYDIYFQAELNKRRKEIWNVSVDRMRALMPKALERLEQEIEVENGWKIALEIIKMAGIEKQHIKDIGHDDAKKILNELADKEMFNNLFSSTSDSTREEILNDLQNKLD
ncbi:helix-turn-helix domain-containing protein [Priestia megaterium]|uniref:helix-turn-helix domain-containing protein n=1 Tax=Priestia megaterium TaxID=1404 RepID=UPI00194E20EA|nr:helix-turn-helix domain-containing protein [Priestia megaterium]MBM6599550.1 hypothetical protein [Priestia megaterium]